MSPAPPQPTLYSFRRCPYAIRARLAIKASGVSVALREIVLRAKPPEMLHLSPKGTVPVLHLPSGEVIDQSLDIMRWALCQHDPQGWLAQAQHPAFDHLIELNDTHFKRLLDGYKYPGRHEALNSMQCRDLALESVLQPLEDLLHAQAAMHPQAQLLGPHPSLVDMALLPFIRQFAQVDADWFQQAPLPALRAWLHAHLNSPLFACVMIKCPVWHSGAPEFMF